MRYLFLLLFSVIAGVSFGQQAYDIDSASYVWVKKNRVNFYLQPYYEQAPVLDETAGNVGLSWGLMVNDRFTAGSFVSVKVDNTYLPLVFPNSFTLNMVHGGLQLGYLSPVSDRISVGVDMRASMGEMEVSFRETFEDLSSARFRVLQPGIISEYQLFRFAKVYISASYRLVQGLELNGVDQESFNGVTWQIGMKLGLFKRLKWQYEED